jgi:hypothetical protein
MVGLTTSSTTLPSGERDLLIRVEESAGNNSQPLRTEASLANLDVTTILCRRFIDRRCAV